MGPPRRPPPDRSEKEIEIKRYPAITFTDTTIKGHGKSARQNVDSNPVDRARRAVTPDMGLPPGGGRRDEDVFEDEGGLGSDVRRYNTVGAAPHSRIKRFSGNGRG